MRVAWLHASLQVRLFFRSPVFVITVLAYPTLLFLFVGAPFAGTHDFANQELVGFAAFAMLTNTFFMLGSGVAATRATHWEKWLRTLPAGGTSRLMGRVLGTLPFACISATTVAIVASVDTPARLSSGQWLRLIGLLLLGFLAFGCLALTLGYWIAPMNAGPIITVTFLVLAYTGNLWASVRPLPATLQTVARFMPSAYWHGMMVSSIQREPIALTSLFGLVGYTLVFGVLAVAGFQRDSQRAPWLQQ